MHVIVMPLMIEVASMHVPLMAVAPTPSPVKRHCSVYSLDGPSVIMEPAWRQGMLRSPY